MVRLGAVMTEEVGAERVNGKARGGEKQIEQRHTIIKREVKENVAFVDKKVMQKQISFWLTFIFVFFCTGHIRSKCPNK